MTHQAFTTLLLAASLLVPGASALGGSHWRGAMHNGKFWKKSDVRKELHLTDDEVRNFDRIFARDQNKLKDLKADVEKRREDLDAMLVADKVDDKQVLDQVDVLEQARARLGKARAMMVLEMRSVLTPEQRAKLAQLRAERREHQRGKERHDNAQEPSPSKHETLPTEGGSPSGRSVAVNAAATLLHRLRRGRMDSVAVPARATHSVGRPHCRRDGGCRADEGRIPRVDPYSSRHDRCDSTPRRGRV